MVFVVVSGLPSNVDTTDLAAKINTYFGENKEIGTFRMIIDDSDTHRPKAVLKFMQGFDAMEAQRLLDNFKYSDPDTKMIYNIKATVPTNVQPYLSLFSEENTDIADVIKAEKRKQKKEKKAKKRKHSPVEEDLADRLGLSKLDLDTVDIEKLEKLCKKLRKKKEKAEKLSLLSEESTSESEYKKRIRDRSIHGESSGVSKRLISPEGKIHKYRGYSSYGESSKSPQLTMISRERTRSTSDSVSPRSVDSGNNIPKHYKRVHTPDDTASTKSYDSRRIKMEYRRPSESQSADERKLRLRSELYDDPISRDERDKRCERPREDLRYKVDARRSSRMESRPRDYERDYGNKAPKDSPRIKKSSHSEGNSRSDKDIRSSNESTDSEYMTVPQLLRGKRLLLLNPLQYLDENDTMFKEAVDHIIHTVATNTERLQEDDKKLILDNYTQTVVNRLKTFKFTNLMTIQDIVLDYKLTYKTADDKLLINTLIKELQALGKGVLLPEIKEECLGQAIDEVLETTNIDELMEDVKPEIKTENVLEYEYEDGETTEVINVVINLRPIEKGRELPFETDPEKVTDIKVFASKLKNTRPNKFFRPIRSLLNEMKLFIYKNAKVVPSEVILNRMVEVLEKIITRILEPVKTRFKSKDVCNLFRNSFPYKEDQEFVDMIIKWILDGEFDKGAIDELISDKIVLPKPEKNPTTDEDNSTNVPRSHSQTFIKQEVSIKVENTNNEGDKEQTITTNVSEVVEQIPKEIQIKREQQVKDDDDVIIKKEPVDVILIEDDNIVVKNEPVNKNVPEHRTIKMEPMMASDSEDEGALSDSSQKTQIIETKPFFGDMEVTDEAISHIHQGATDKSIKNELDRSDETPGEPSVILNESGEILEGPGEILEGPGEILEGPGEILEGPGEILEGPGEILEGPGEILEGPGEILEGPGEILEGPGKRMGEILEKPIEILDEPGEIFEEPAETIDDIRLYLKSETD